MATNKKRKNETAFKIFSPLLRLIFRLYYNPTIINKEAIPKEGPILLVCNHKHVFDQCFIIMATKRPIRYMAKKEYFDGKFAWFFRLAGCIPVDRSIHDDAAKAAALEVLDLDGAVGLFPEGTRNKTNDKFLLDFKFGTVSMAAVTAYGIFYKIQQFIFFAGFGLRDAITPIVSFNYGMGDKKRVKQGIFYGILYIEIVMLVGIIGLELFADPLIGLFAMSSETEKLCVLATRIIAAGFLFAGGNIAIQGVFQALECGLDSLIVSLLRLFVVVLPLAWIFTKFENATFMIWFAFPIAEVVALIVAVILMSRANKKIVKQMKEKTE